MEVERHWPQVSLAPRASWILYLALLLLRVFVAPFLPGYIHPDEFFQGGQELWFGCPPTIPWEFEPHNALRSVLPPTIMTWIPLKLYSKLSNLPMEQLSSWTILILPRVGCATLSVLTVDATVWSVSRKPLGGGVPASLLLLASAWPTMALLNRPFSNAMEAWLVALLLAIVARPIQSVTSGQCLLVGAIGALGVFTRFTFLLFAFPCAIYFLGRMLRQGTILRVLAQILLVGTAFLVVSCAIVKTDSEFYASFYGRTEVEGSGWVLTPWNALSYNSKVANLQEHGLHPRWTHALVNMFLLFGPLTAMAYVLLPLPNSHILEADTRAGDKAKTHSDTIVLAKSMVLSGLAFLSLAPHQEPRFLLPLLVPLVLLGDSRWLRYKSVVCIWLLFNLVLLLLFGGLHQSGIGSALRATSKTQSGSTPSSILYFHTYMPPTFMARVGSEGVCDEGGMIDSSPQECRVCPSIPIRDLKGSDLSTLLSALDTELSCSTRQAGQIVHLVSPPLELNIDGSSLRLSGECTLPGYECQLLSSHGPHLTTEDLPPFEGSIVDFFQRGLVLNVYKLSCQP